MCIPAESSFRTIERCVCRGALINVAPPCTSNRYTKKKDIYLLWITRDSGMVALFEKQVCVEDIIVVHWFTPLGP